MYLLQELAETCRFRGQGDVAALNIASSLGLPGAEKVDVRAICRTLDLYKEEVKAATAKHLTKFRANPARCENSEGKFSMEVLVTVLQQDKGFRYDPALMKSSDFFRDSSKVFLHGVMASKKGTCANLPVLYVAVGRRLGYPLKLVASKWHLFARWEGQGERFNIECTSKGFLSRPDEHYLNYPEPTSKEQADEFGFLKSKSPQEELALFFNNRGCCLSDNGNHRGAVHSFAWASDLEPANQFYLGTLSKTMNSWMDKLKEVWPKGFPTLRIYFPPRVFKNLPEDRERHIHHLCVMDGLLYDKDMNDRWWNALRRNDAYAYLPKSVEVRFKNSQDFNASFSW